MNNRQAQALDQLAQALREATDSLLFEEVLNCVMHPDTINRFCDGVCDLRPIKEVQS